jgi:hypothetical protein
VPSSYKSDKVKNYEIGAKNNFDNRIKIASSLYYIRWNNIQQNVIPPVCGISFISNLGAAIAKGGDIQVEAAITDNFTAELTAGYTDARYISTSFFGAAVDPTTGLPNAPIANRGDAITGQSLQPNVPFAASIGLEYRFKVMQYASFVRFDDEFQGRAHQTSPQQDGATAQFDDANYRLSPTNFASARAGVSLGKLQLAAFVDNLFDTHTVTNYNFTTPSADTRLERQFTFRPRTIGLTFTYRH